MDEESDFLPIQCDPGVVDGGVDRISELPDEINFVILYFLSLKEAAATSVLSSRWPDLWKHIPNLDFDYSDLKTQDGIVQSDDDILDFDDDTVDSDEEEVPANEKRIIEIVNSVIQSHKAISLKIFRVHLLLRKPSMYAIPKWLEFVLARQVESLELNILCSIMNPPVLGELLRDSGICLQPQTDLIFFQSLKRLRLCWLKVSGEDFELFLRGCPLLEELIIRDSILTSNVEVRGAKLMLKRLDIICKGEKSIKVSAPNLTYAMLVNRRGKLLFENAQDLLRQILQFKDQILLLQHFATFPICKFST